MTAPSRTPNDTRRAAAADGVVVVCPLAFEAAAVRRAIAAIDPNGRPRVVVSGPGPDNAARAVRELPERVSTVLLVGVAGAIGPSFTPDAAWAGRIIGEGAAEPHVPTVTGSSSPPPTILGLAHPAFDPAHKRRLFESTGAQLIDTESHAFARACAERDRTTPTRWGVLRGVSDGPAESLPQACTNWVDDRGRTRISRVLRDVIARRVSIGDLTHLGRRSKIAMHAATALLVERLADGFDDHGIAHDPRTSPRPTEVVR